MKPISISSIKNVLVVGSWAKGQITIENINAFHRRWGI